MIVLSLFKTTFPWVGAVAIDTLDTFSVPPLLPAASFAKIFTVTGVPDLVVAKSLLATGLSVITKGSITVISKGVNGQFVVWPGAHTGT